MMRAWEWRDAPAARFAVIGDPISHSRSPVMHEAALRHRGLPGAYVAVRVPRGEVVEALDWLRDLGYEGVNVTVPHKEEAAQWCRPGDDFAERVGVVNTVRLKDRVGINTDGPGFLETLRDAAFEPRTGPVLLLGAGGAARAVAFALADAGAEVRIFNRTRERAEVLAAEAGGRVTAVPVADLAGAALVVNATSAHLGEGAPLELYGEFSPAILAYDLSYAAGGTPFLRVAQAAGARVLDGLDLLVAQGALSLEWWTGCDAPRDVMRAAVR